MRQHANRSWALITAIFLMIACSACQGGATTTTNTTTATGTVPTTQTTTTTPPVNTTATTRTTTTTPAATTTALAERLAAIHYSNYPVVDGSTATIPLALGLIKAITGCSDAQAEEATLFNKTDPSYYALAEGRSDLLLVYEAAQNTVDELDIYSKMDVREIGLDALVFIVNEDNPVQSLTADQIRGIYSGKITNWREVGGADIAIVPFQRPELSGSQTMMLKLMMKDTAMIAPTTELISESMADIIEDVAAYNNSANAIGYSVYYYAKNMFTQPGLKFLAIDGVLPSNATINDRTYGYVNPFFGVLPLDPKPEAEALLDWLLTREGQQLLSDCGYVPVMKLD
jgi:hypothetical protein